MTGQLVHLAMWVGLTVMEAGPRATPRPLIPREPRAHWARVSQKEQDKGLELFTQANQAIHRTQPKEAVRLYRQALTHWDHPAFHYNLAIALLAVSDTLECHRQLEEATRYGPEPLRDREKYDNAMRILSEVEGQLARLELTCDERGAEVTVDDRKVDLSCPGSFAQWKQPGIHVVRITKSGFYPTTKNLNLQPGERPVVPLRLYTEAEWTRIRTRWPPWMPWVVMGSGVAAVGVGGWLHVYSGDQFKVYDRGITACAGGGPSQPVFKPCLVSETLERPRVVADVSQGVAWGLYGGGIVVLGSASVLLSLNFPQPYLVDPESDSAPRSRPMLVVAPMLGPDSRGIVVGLSF